MHGKGPERQRSHVRTVSGAPEGHVPRVPGLWRENIASVRRALSQTLESRVCQGKHSSQALDLLKAR